MKPTLLCFVHFGGRFFCIYEIAGNLEVERREMALHSIPPVQRGLVKKRGTARLGTDENSRIRTPSVRTARQGILSPSIMSPSICDVKVTRTPNGGTWEFPHGEFEVTLKNREIHVEVKIGRFIDALILQTAK